MDGDESQVQGDSAAREEASRQAAARKEALYMFRYNLHIA